MPRHGPARQGVRQRRRNRLSSGHLNPNAPGLQNPMPRVPRAPAAPSVAHGAPGGSNVPSSYPFLDSTYYANTAQNQFNANTDISGIRQQDTYNQTDAFTAKARLDQSEPYAEQGLRENAVRQGTFGSTRTNTQIGLQQRDYLQQRGDIDLKAARTHAANTAAIQAILAGLPLQQASEMASAADRQTTRDQAAADAGVLTQNPSSASAPPSQAVTAPQNGSGRGGRVPARPNAQRARAGSQRRKAVQGFRSEQARVQKAKPHKRRRK
jgi:hypothetical protein